MISFGRGGEGWSEGFSFPLSNPVSLLKGLLPQSHCREGKFQDCVPRACEVFLVG